MVNDSAKPKKMSNRVPTSFPKNHPLWRINSATKAWLIVFIGAMFLNGSVAGAILLGPFIRPIPFWLMAFTAGVWLFNTWNDKVIIACSSLITVGLFLRALEVLIFASIYPVGTRITGFSLWTMVAVAMIIFGLLDLVATSRVRAHREANPI